MKHFDEAEVREIGINDSDYPELLKSIGNPPEAIRIVGSLPPSRRIVAISGSRKPIGQAFSAAFRIGRMLAEHGYTIVTGLALGCDAEAVKGALSVDGNVIGVVPWGLKSLRTHTKEFAEKVFAGGGAVISEYPDDLSKIPDSNFLRRNEVITGISEKTIVIAATERSGSAATARRAIQQGREVIVTVHFKANVKPVTLVESPVELKKVLGIERNS